MDAYVQTKNTQTDNYEVASDSVLPLYHSQVVSHLGLEDQSVSKHDGALTSAIAGVTITGVSGCEYAAGDCIDVQKTGVVMVRTEAAVVKGEQVAPGATGDIVPHVPGTTPLLGVALASVPAGSRVHVRLTFE